ncbi:MAG: type II toxin-antitoxin system VapC family toxin [Elusimicrobia bacterium]|nr:type II toxin-antitoxin system VapC family toxin [Elusimicrobiota bacterium]
MRLALDTNAYRAAADSDPRTIEILSRAEEIWIPFVVLGELRGGFAAGAIPLKNEAALTFFLGSPRVRILLADDQTTHHYAFLYGQLRRQGTPIPTNDLWIAALVVQHDLPLLSSDSHFTHLPQIARL